MSPITELLHTTITGYFLPQKLIILDVPVYHIFYLMSHSFIQPILNPNHVSYRFKSIQCSRPSQLLRSFVHTVEIVVSECCILPKISGVHIYVTLNIC